jgi:DNA-binding protein HU-beta
VKSTVSGETVDFTLSPYFFKPYCIKRLISYTSSRSPSVGLYKKPYLGITLFTTMNKADIAAKVQEVLGGTKADAERAVETVISSITDGLKGGDEVSIAGLGIFSAKARPARTGRNPRTGETIKIAATRTPKFRAAKALKDAVK